MATICEFDVQSDSFQSDPWKLYARVHSEDLVLKDRSTGSFFLGRYAQVHRVLGSSLYTTAPLAVRAQPVLGARVLAQMEGVEHAVKRRAVLSQLTARRFREHHAALLEQLVDQLIQRVCDRGSLDLMRDFGSDYSILATLRVLGLPVDRHDEVASWQQGVTRFITSLGMTEEERDTAFESSRCLIEYLTPIVAAAAEGFQQGMVSQLRRAQVDHGVMSVQECVALVMNLLLAASEPADKTLGYLFHHLLSDPEIFRRVSEERGLLAAALEETLRLTPPVHLVPRQLQSEDEVDGVRLPAGSSVFCMIGAANRDPAVYENPDRFILPRQRACSAQPGRGRHLAFGAGPHICVGAAFSLMQLELTANALIDRLPGLRLPGTYELRERGTYTRGPSAVHVEFDVANPREAARVS